MNNRIRAKRYAQALMLAAVILGGSGCAGAAGGFIDFLIHQFGWQGTSCLINVLIFNVPCSKPDRPVCPSGCTLGWPQDHGDLTCSWITDPNKFLCGKTVLTSTQIPGQPPQPSRLTCKVCGLAGTSLIGFDAIPPVTATPNVASITPPPGKLLDPTGKIVIKFRQTMDATSVVLSSDMAGEAGPYAFSRSPDQFLFNDTLTVAPLATWQAGRRALTADLKDESGNPANVNASWFVLAPGQAASPDFSTCTTGCGQRWFLPYGVQFTASGGFPPYVWSIPNGNVPPHDGNIFAVTGVFSGGPTFCFLCPYGFTVCVTDQAQSQTCHPVQWDSGL